MTDSNVSIAALCSPGYYSPTGVEDCDACAIGFYSTEAGASFCEECPDGFSTFDIASDDVALCSRGIRQTYFILEYKRSGNNTR